jgi:hypothetical protein
MSTVTWSTAPIPAYALRVGDRFDVNGEPLTVVALHARDGAIGISGVFDDDRPRAAVGVSADYSVTVYVPDEPVDGYNLWRPKPGVWPSGCVCVSRRHPTLDGNWETVVRDESCRSHYDNWNHED